MTRRNREINIFSLSAIDLFCSGMGAVMVISVILMPYYLRPETAGLVQELAEARARVEALEAAMANTEEIVSMDEVRDELAELRSERGAMASALNEARADLAEAEARELRSEAESLRGQFVTPFLVIIVSWDNPADDVDLHIVDPNGNRFYFENGRHRGSPAYIEVDSIRGPGNEVWIHPSATPGTYRIECVFYQDVPPIGPVTVRGVAIFQGGRLEFPPLSLPGANQNSPRIMAEVVVSEQGEVSLR